eukprot:15470769-Alexandrium_andersonii.AAC.1
MASVFAPKAPEGCVLHPFLRRCRICRRNGSAGASDALLGGFRGDGACRGRIVSVGASMSPS